MRKLLALLLIVAGTLLAGAGIFMLNGRDTVFAVVLIGLGLLLGVGAWHIDRKMPKFLPAGQLTPFSPDTQALVVNRRKSRIVPLAVLFGFITWLVAGGMIGMHLDSKQGFLFALVPGIAVALLYVQHMLGNAPFLRVDSYGVTHGSHPVMPWSDVEGIRVLGITHKGHTQNHLHIRVKSPDKYRDWSRGLNRYQLRKQHIVHFHLMAIDTDPLILFEKMVRAAKAANKGAMLTSFSGTSEWGDWVRDAAAKVPATHPGDWEQRIRDAFYAMHGGWMQFDDFETSTLKLKLQAAEKSHMDGEFAALDHALNAAVARGASESEIKALFDNVSLLGMNDSPEVAALKAEIKTRTDKVIRQSKMVAFVFGALFVLWILWRFSR